MSEATRYSVVVDGRMELLAPDDAIPAGQRARALVRGRLLDELTMQPVAGPITVTPYGDAFASAQARAAVNPRWASGGIVGLVGVASRAFPALRISAYDVGVRAVAGGYLPATLSQPLGPDALFPAQFTPALLPDIQLHRVPVILSGRAVVQGAGSTAPLSGANITISGIWRTAPSPVLGPPPAPADLLAVDPPLYAAQPAATTTFRDVTLVPDLLNVKRLRRGTLAGTRVLALSDRVSISAGDVLEVDPGDPGRSEAVVIAAIDGSTTDTEPAVVTLEHPFSHSHAADAVARRVDVTLPGPAQTLSVDAIEGDTTLLVTAAAGLAAGTIEIDDGTAVPQYHRMTLYNSTSNGDGFWSLPPLSRVAVAQLTATHATHPTITRTLAPEYPRREQRVDFVFT